MVSKSSKKSTYLPNTGRFFFGATGYFFSILQVAILFYQELRLGTFFTVFLTRLVSNF
jgi:hypothetical protein